MLLITWTASAQVKFTEKGQPAEFTGYLFTPEKELEVRQKLLDLDYQKVINDSKTRELDLHIKQVIELNHQIDLYQTSTNKLIERTMSDNRNTFWGGFAYFLVGAGVTTLITYGVRK